MSRSVVNNLAVQRALGPETMTITLDDRLRPALRELCDRLALGVPMARFGQTSPGEGDKVVLVLPAGSYGAARRVAQEILRDIYGRSAA